LVLRVSRVISDRKVFEVLLVLLDLRAKSVLRVFEERPGLLDRLAKQVRRAPWDLRVLRAFAVIRVRRVFRDLLVLPVRRAILAPLVRLAPRGIQEVLGLPDPLVLLAPLGPPVRLEPLALPVLRATQVIPARSVLLVLRDPQALRAFKAHKVFRVPSARSELLFLTIWPTSPRVASSSRPD
jgi:hypothetical protein